MRRTPALFLSTALLLFTGRAAAFCDCLPTPEPFEALMRADAVFEAKVLARLPYTDRGDEVWAIETLRAWKGTSTRDDTPIRNNVICFAPLRPGKTYLFYAYTDPDGTRTIDLCTRIVAADDAAADLSEIGPPTETRAPSQPSVELAPPRPAASAPPSHPRTSCAPSCATAGPTDAPPMFAATLVVLFASVCRRRRDPQLEARNRGLALLLVFAWLLSTLFLAGCDPLPEGACLDRGDCPDGLACVRNHCRDFASYCRDGETCRTEGLCKPGGDSCKAAGDEDCRPSRECAESAKCTARNGECVVASSEDCARSNLCRWEARCTFADGSCKLLSDKDCRASEKCTLKGACHLNAKGECHTANADDCRTSRTCKRDGKCSLKSGLCSVTSDADCAGSERCKKYGACLARNGYCVRSCAKWWGCRVGGECTESGGSCVPTSEDDCRKSRVCKGEGRCTFIKSREADLPGRCACASVADCRQSDRCKVSGACDFEKDRCVAKSEKDCQASKNCREWAQCTLGDGQGGSMCDIGSDADCEMSTLCAVEGRCVMREGRCVVQAADACKKSQGCKASGLCSFSAYGEAGVCLAAKDADCLASEDCKKFGHCSADRNVCVRR